MKSTNIPYLVIGDINLDIIMQADQFPAEGGEVVTDTTTFRLGGSGCNTAVCLAKFGFPTDLVAGMGFDPFGKVVTERLERSGIHERFILREKNYQTGFFLIVITPSGERTMFGDRGSNLTPPPAEKIRPILPDIRAIHISGYSLIDPAQNEAIHQILKDSQPYQPCVSVDPGYFTMQRVREKIHNVLPYLDFLLLSEDELQLWNSSRSLELNIEDLFSSGVKNIILKRGKAGSDWFTKEEHFHQDAYQHPDIPIYDTTGAGDCYNAGFFFGYHNQLSPRDCLALGNLNAFIAITSTKGVDHILSCNDVLSEMQTLLGKVDDMKTKKLLQNLRDPALD